MKIFATGVFGSGFDKWGALSFTDKGTRDKLAANIAPEDRCLVIGTKSKPTDSEEQGRLLALLRIGPELVETSQLVDPEVWKSVEADYGRPRWPYAFPIREVSRFVPGPTGLPNRSDILPRIDLENRYMQVARHYLELTEEEVQRVVSLPRIPDYHIFSSPISEFASRLLRIQNGPPPTVGTRMLSSTSGPAATYIMQLTGSAIEVVMAQLSLDSDKAIYKIGFSNNPQRRLKEINSFFPDDFSLLWSIERTQWHEDEVNAFVLEQKTLSLLSDFSLTRFKGEMFFGSPSALDEVWNRAKNTAERPSIPITVEVTETLNAEPDFITSD